MMVQESAKAQFCNETDYFLFSRGAGSVSARTGRPLSFAQNGAGCILDREIVSNVHR